MGNILIKPDKLGGDASLFFMPTFLCSYSKCRGLTLRLVGFTEAPQGRSPEDSQTDQSSFVLWCKTTLLLLLTASVFKAFHIMQMIFSLCDWDACGSRMTAAYSCALLAYHNICRRLGWGGDFLLYLYIAKEVK